MHKSLLESFDPLLELTIFIGSDGERIMSIALMWQNHQIIQNYLFIYMVKNQDVVGWEGGREG